MAWTTSRNVSVRRGGSATGRWWTVVCVGLGVSLAGTSAHACESPIWPQARALAASNAVVEAIVLDPAVQQDLQPDSGRPAFARQRWLLRVVRVEARRRAGRPKNVARRIDALVAGAALQVDEADWRGALQHHRQCAQADSCEPRCAPAMATRLAREPVASQRVRAYLLWTPDGWSLVADRAFDAVVASEAR